MVTPFHPEFEQIITEIFKAKQVIKNEVVHPFTNDPAFDLFIQVRDFDLYSDYSDDASVWRRAKKNAERISLEADKYPHYTHALKAGLSLGTRGEFNTFFSDILAILNERREARQVLLTHSSIVKLLEYVDEGLITIHTVHDLWTVRGLINESYYVTRPICGAFVRGNKGPAVGVATKALAAHFGKLPRVLAINADQARVVDQVYDLLIPHREVLVAQPSLLSHIGIRTEMVKKFMVIETMTFRTLI